LAFPPPTRAMEFVGLKNTFLETISSTEESMRSRSKSCSIDPVRTKCAAKELVLTEPPCVKNKELDTDDDMELPTYWSRQSCTNGREPFRVDVVVPVHQIEVASSKASTDEPAADAEEKKKSRPCKGKRHRYKKLVHRLQKKISENPEVFTMDEVVLPPSLQANANQRLKLIDRMERYQNKVLTPYGRSSYYVPPHW